MLAVAKGYEVSANHLATVPFDEVEFYFVRVYALAIDNVRYDAPESVPEPGSLFLLGTGLVGLRAWQKRRQ